MLTVFFDCDGVIRHEFLSHGQMVNKQCYLKVIKRLREALRIKRPDFWRGKKWLLHHDNVSVHSPLLICI